MPNAVSEKEPLNIAIVEDTAADAQYLDALIEATGVPHLTQTFESGESLLEGFLPGTYDLVFLDVFMYEINGVETAARIREVDECTVIVFTTTTEDYTREGYRLNAYKYLIKPLVAEDVADAVDLAVLKRDRERDASLSIVSENQLVVLPFSEIILVESSNRSSLIVTATESYTTLMTIDVLEKLLPPPRFIRSHRSFIVNLDHVDELADDFIMDNGAIVYVTVKNHRKIKRVYEDFLFAQVRSSGASS